MNGPNISLVAGPFVSEAAARKYEKVGAWLACAKGIVPNVSDFGVSAVSGGYHELGPLNDELGIDPEDLVRLAIQNA